MKLKNHSGKALALAALALFVAPSISHANGYLVPGTTRSATANYDEWDSPDSISVPGTVDNSYYCRAPVLTGFDALDFESSILGPSATAPALTFLGTADGVANTEGAFAFVAQATGSHLVGIASTSAGTGGSSGALAQIECFNTTLFGNFNTVTAANPVNFLELKNISTNSLEALIVVRTFAGTEITRFTRTIPAGQRQDIGIHDLGGSAVNTFGSVQVAHNGALGALVGNVSKYQVSGTSLNITATEPLRERVQN